MSSSRTAGSEPKPALKSEPEPVTEPSPEATPPRRLAPSPMTERTQSSLSENTERSVSRTDHPPSLLIHPPANTSTNQQARKPAAYKPAPRFWRRSVISTPLPMRDNRPIEKDTAMVEHQMREWEGGVLPILLYSRRRRAPGIARVVFPRTQKSALEAASANHGKNAIIPAKFRNFDDEQLFRLVRVEYRKLRGILADFVSARNVRDLGFLSYAETSQLTKKDNATRRKTYPVQRDEDDFAETRLLDLYLQPKLGRGKHDWVEWIARLPQTSSVEESGEREERVALELVEDWSVGKIGFAVLAVLILALLATLLWIFLGIEGGPHCLCHWRTSQMAPTSANGRIGTGVVLGILVLLFGWTGVGFWVFLSWAV